MAFYLENPMQEMEERIIGFLIDIKADIGGLKKDVGELKEGQQRIEEQVGNLESDVSELKVDVSELKADMVDVKGTVHALDDASLETSREVTQMQGKS